MAMACRLHECSHWIATRDREEKAHIALGASSPQLASSLRVSSYSLYAGAVLDVADEYALVIVGVYKSVKVSCARRLPRHELTKCPEGVRKSSRGCCACKTTVDCVESHPVDAQPRFISSKGEQVVVVLFVPLPEALTSSVVLSASKDRDRPPWSVRHEERGT